MSFLFLSLLAAITQAANPKVNPKVNPKTPSKDLVGGQAVLEGVMMRGPKSWAVAIRSQDGQVKSVVKDHIPWTKRSKIFSLPLVRGVIILFESLVIGYKAMNYSASFQAEDLNKAKEAPKLSLKKGLEINPPKGLKNDLSLAEGPENDLPANDTPENDPIDATAAPAASLPQKPPTLVKLEGEGNISPDPNRGADSAPSLGLASILFTLFLSILLAAGLFMVLPHVLSMVLGHYLSFNEEHLSFHVVDGIIKFIIFLLYVWAIGFIPDIGRVFAYHGAEHKAIYTYEADLPLTPMMARHFPLWHRRCGTAFIFLLLAISILFFACFFPLLFHYSGDSKVMRALLATGIKMLLMFPLAGIAYEITRRAAARQSSILWKAAVFPGLVLQRLTTREPDDNQLEVAFVALKKVANAPSGPKTQISTASSLNPEDQSCSATLLN
ncbi:MAG: DUF1385 domain-containing protein [Deltaproteobacteria bacterium]|jgi:uncharacterized protein YqhQ|nr:DUF1385 domain-containing protein [Deltaproteobacteria bacterium]